MPEHVTIHIEGHLLEHGLWCDRCLLPSAYRVAIVRSGSTGVDFVRAEQRWASWEPRPLNRVGRTERPRGSGRLRSCITIRCPHGTHVGSALETDASLGGRGNPGGDPVRSGGVTGSIPESATPPSETHRAAARRSITESGRIGSQTRDTGSQGSR